jgi:hypothetical protein
MANLQDAIRTIIRVTAGDKRLGFIGESPPTDSQGDPPVVTYWWIADLGQGVQQWGDGCPDQDTAMRCVLAAHKRRKEVPSDSALAFSPTEETTPASE